MQSDAREAWVAKYLDNIRMGLDPVRVEPAPVPFFPTEFAHLGQEVRHDLPT